MPCQTLNKGRKLACKGGTGGLKAASFAVYTVSNSITATDGTVATLPAALTAVYRYELKNAGNTYTEEIVADPEMRTVVYNGTLALVLQKLDIDTRNEVKMLTMGEVIIFLEDYNGNVFVIGNEVGAQLTGGNFVTGGARGDMSGANLTFSTTENEPYLTLSTAAKATYELIAVDGN